jgi:hypothetical protein
MTRCKEEVEIWVGMVLQEWGDTEVMVVLHQWDMEVMVVLQMLVVVV